MHDFVRDSVRATLMKARPVPQFMAEIHAHATASAGLTPGARDWAVSEGGELTLDAASATGTTVLQPSAGNAFALHAPIIPPVSARLQFEGGIAVDANAAVPVARGLEAIPDNGCAPEIDVAQIEEK